MADLTPANLHRHHAAPASGRGGSSFDLGPVRWRGEGGDGDLKRAMAYRLALSWNLCEGWPTEALERGVLREVDEGLVELLALLSRTNVPDNVWDAAARLRALLAECDAHIDLTDGRAHDCQACLGQAGDEA